MLAGWMAGEEPPAGVADHQGGVASQHRRPARAVQDPLGGGQLGAIEAQLQALNRLSEHIHRRLHH
jgi:hypothetical protein